MQRRETTLSLRRNVTENAVKEIRLLISTRQRHFYRIQKRALREKRKNNRIEKLLGIFCF